MKKGRYISYLLLSFIIGLFVIPSILNWLGFPYSFVDILHSVLGELNTVNRIIVIGLAILLLLVVGRSFYKDYKKLND